MEEILSSIRRIISADSASEEGESAEQASPVQPAPPPAKTPQDDVLELTDAIEEDAPAEELDIDVDAALGSFEPDEHVDEPEFEDDEGDEPEPAYAPPPIRDRDQHEASLVSPPTAAASVAAFASLHDMSSLSRPAGDIGGRTVEQLAAELMRPILRDWLDQNLPGMVERLVRAEIKKLAEQSRSR